MSKSPYKIGLSFQPSSLEWKSVSLPSSATRKKNSRNGRIAVSKFALPALVLIIFGLFYFAAPQTPYEPVEVADVPAAPAPISPTVTEPAKEPAQVAAKEPVRETARDDRQQQLPGAIDGIRAELKRLSDEAKATNDKLAQATALRSDVENSKSSIDNAQQFIRDQIGALRADQTKALNETREAGDKAAQTLRQEVAASQAKLADQLGETLKANTARAEALAQRVDAMRKDVDDIKKSIDESRESAFNVSPGLAIIVALAALVLGPLVARQLTANQLAAARQQAEAEAAAAATAARRNRVDTEMNPPLAPSSVTPPHEEPPHRDDTATTHEASALHHDGDPPTSQDREKA